MTGEYFVVSMKLFVSCNNVILLLRLSTMGEMDITMPTLTLKLTKEQT